MASIIRWHYNDNDKDNSSNHTTNCEHCDHHKHHPGFMVSRNTSNKPTMIIMFIPTRDTVLATMTSTCVLIPINPRHSMR